ncbi:MAG: ECF transporter S component [Lachnospiraceae bacterium]|nr:ECF transporter S component [Lachnospiraceae bacterium]
MNNKTKTIVGVGLLTAIVIILQALALNIRFGMFTISLCLVPIIVGAALYGYKAGAWLGFVFSAVVMFTDTAAFMAISIPGTIITVMVKGTVAGLVAGLVYLALKEKNQLAAVIAAGVAAPVVNTGIFVLGCFAFFYDTICEWGAAAGFESGAAFILFGIVGANFLVELAINLVLSAVIVQIVNLGRKEVLARA